MLLLLCFRGWLRCSRIFLLMEETIWSEIQISNLIYKRWPFFVFLDVNGFPLPDKCWTLYIMNTISLGKRLNKVEVEMSKHFHFFSFNINAYSKGSWCISGLAYTAWCRGKWSRYGSMATTKYGIYIYISFCDCFYSKSKKSMAF